MARVRPTGVNRVSLRARGVRTLGTNPWFQSLGYAGGLEDRATGLVRFGARDYEPATGRWTAKDPIGFAGEDPNLFVYASSGPVDLIDPDGLLRLPADPRQLPPGWKRDPRHGKPSDPDRHQRYTNPRYPGQHLDFDPGQPGEPGFRGEDHWKYSWWKKGEGNPHKRPGCDIPDPPEPDEPWWYLELMRGLNAAPWEIPFILAPPGLNRPPHWWTGDGA